MQRGMSRYAVALWVAIGTGAVFLQGCDSGCDPETIDAAGAFLDAHQSCETDADCVVVRDSCGEVPGGYCGQLTMNRLGAESAQWRAITEELSDCAPESCAECLALLIPRCTNNVCSKR